MKVDAILTVCLGNICRSPMAEILLRAALPSLHIQSAGLAAMIGQGADAPAIELMAEQGLDLNGHRARQLEGWMVQKFGLILVAEARQKRHIEQRYPFARGRVYRLCEYAGVDVPDPYRQNREQYRRCGVLIRQGVDAWARRLQRIDHTS